MTIIAQYTGKMTNFRDPVTLDDLEKYAATHLDKNAFDYYSTGAGDDVSLHENREAFKRYFDLSSIEKKIQFIYGIIYAGINPGVLRGKQSRLMVPKISLDLTA